MLLILTMTLSACAIETDGHVPNVVLITVDTLRPDFLGAYGFEGGSSPRLDALAERCVVFEHAIAASSRTAPSHASIMTGLFVREHSIGPVNGATRLAAGTTTLASRYRRAGYDTAAFVGNTMLERRIGLDGGFDVYDDTFSEAEPSRPHVFERTAGRTTTRVLEWLSKPRGRPFFLWVHYQDPHGPYTPPPAFVDRIRLEPRPGDKALPVLPDQTGRGGIPAYQVIPGLHHETDYLRRYAGEIRYVDESLGTLLDAVVEREGEGGTIILLTSDHGESLGEDGVYFAHGHATTPDQARVPLTVCAPGIPAGRRSETVHHVDIPATLLELSGLPVPEDMTGVSLVRLLREGTPIPDRLVYTNIGIEFSAYRGSEFVRIRFGPTGKSTSVETNKVAPDGTWGPAPAVPEVYAEIQEYLQTPQVELLRIPSSEPEAVERLRALGYLDPEGAGRLKQEH